MNNDRTDKRTPEARHGNDEPREQNARGAAAGEREAAERKPSPIERREWRGSGVCGDRHTD